MNDAIAARGRFRPYTDYRASKVEWVGQIPAHWKMLRLRYIAQLNPTKGEVRGLDSQLPVSFVPMESVGEYGGLTLDAEKPLLGCLEGYTYFREDDVLVAKITPCFENGKGALAAGLSNGIGFGTTELHVLRASSALDKQFLFYLTLSDHFRRLGAASMYGAGGQKRVPEEFIRDLMHPLPDEQEQRAIAAFLDRETAKIDALVAKKERLIDLLQERRSALITQVVTKGLNPNVRLRDSGVEWLREIPAQWEVRRVKSITANHKQGFYTEETYVDEGVRLARITDIDDHTNVLFRNMPFVQIDGKAEVSFRIEPGDFLFARSGTIGRFGVVRQIERAVFASYLIRFRFKGVHPEFLRYAFESQSFQESLISSLHGGANQNVHAENIKERWIAIPPQSEQKSIASHLDRETAKIDALVGPIREAMERLNELRIALISAAVTGKIDVREVPAS